MIKITIENDNQYNIMILILDDIRARPRIICNVGSLLS